MKHYVRVILMLLFAVPLMGALAQGGNENTLIRGMNHDAITFNTVTQTVGASFTAQSYVFPSLYRNDPVTGLPQPSLATWDISDDGLVYTFHIRDDANWTDGKPITAQDVKFTFDSMGSDKVETFRSGNIANFKSISVIDDKTVEIQLTESDCGIWGNLAVPIMPSYKFAADYSDFMTSSFNDFPDVSGGPYILDEWQKDEFIRYRANPDYFMGKPKIDNVILKIIPDLSVMTQALISGEVDYYEVPASTAEDLKQYDNLSVFMFPFNGFLALVLNHADPANPQSAYDEEGNLIEQAPHPLFGDVRVRKAIAMGWNKDDAIKILGEGYHRIASTIPPSIAWAYDSEVQPYPYDPEAAAKLLDEAGWTLNEETGVREKDGMPFEFQLDYIAGSTADDLAPLIQDQLGQLGIVVKLQPGEVGAVVGQRVFPQVFDATIISFNWDLPDPNILTNFALNSHLDVVGSGVTVSYDNPKMDALIAQANSVPGCDVEQRAALYHQIQQITHDDAVYDFIADTINIIAVNNRVGNIEPGSWGQNDYSQWTLNQ